VSGRPVTGATTNAVLVDSASIVVARLDGFCFMADLALEGDPFAFRHEQGSVPILQVELVNPLA